MRAILSIIFNILLFVWTALVSIGGSPLLLGPWYWAMNAQNFWAWGLGIMIKYLLGITYEVRGLEHVPDGACIIAAKHQSTWDTILPHAFLKVFQSPFRVNAFVIIITKLQAVIELQQFFIVCNGFAVIKN